VHHPIDITVDVNVIGNIVMNEFEMRIRAMSIDILQIARDEVINHDHVVSVCQKSIRQMRTDKSGTTRDENSQ
jgi:hypothetical protein